MDIKDIKVLPKLILARVQDLWNDYPKDPEVEPAKDEEEETPKTEEKHVEEEKKEETPAPSIDSGNITETK